jgi:hypothetical protein
LYQKKHAHCVVSGLWCEKLHLKYAYLCHWPTDYLADALLSTNPVRVRFHVGMSHTQERQRYFFEALGRTLSIMSLNLSFRYTRSVLGIDNLKHLSNLRELVLKTDHCDWIPDVLAFLRKCSFLNSASLPFVELCTRNTEIRHLLALR